MNWSRKSNLIFFYNLFDNKNKLKFINNIKRIIQILFKNCQNYYDRRGVSKFFIVNLFV